MHSRRAGLAIVALIAAGAALPVATRAGEPSGSAIAAECEALVKSVEQTRRATRDMLAQLAEQRERAREMAPSLSPEYRKALDGFLDGQERRLQAVLSGLRRVGCASPAQGGRDGAGPAPSNR